MFFLDSDSANTRIHIHANRDTTLTDNIEFFFVTYLQLVVENNIFNEI